MKKDRLHQLFKAHPTQKTLTFQGQCHDCGGEVTVEVKRTANDFEIGGGALFEPSPEHYYYKCHACFQAHPVLSNYQDCEVYSRVVGYLRPVAQWNEGKQAEFDDRTPFAMERTHLS